MGNEQLQYTRAAQRQLQALPAEVRLHLETHLENLALLIEATSPERLLQLLARDEEGFVTSVQGARVHFVVNAAARSVLVHRLEQLPVNERAATDESAAALEGR
jgi:GTP cyclohydrolase FolE2